MDALTANLLANGAIGIILLASFGLALKIEGIVRSRLFHFMHVQATQNQRPGVTNA